MLAIWNSLPGVTPAKGFKNPKVAASRIWGRIQGMTEPEKAIDAAPKAERNLKGGAQSAKGGSAKGKSSKKATPAEKSPKASKAAAKPAKAESGSPREGSKAAQVVAMLQRKNGATLSEIMERWAGRSILFGASWQGL
jgi:hypothetical protein